MGRICSRSAGCESRGADSAAYEAMAGATSLRARGENKRKTHTHACNQLSRPVHVKSVSARTPVAEAKTLEQSDNFRRQYGLHSRKSKRGQPFSDIAAAATLEQCTEREVEVANIGYLFVRRFHADRNPDDFVMD